MECTNLMSSMGPILAQRQYDGEGLGALAVIFVLFAVVLAVIVIAGLWKVFTKAGQPGWAAIIPIYNSYILLKIADKPTWWIIWFILPILPIPIIQQIAAIVSIVFSILVWAEVCRRFGKGGGFVAGIILLPVVFIMILGFGSAQYCKPQVAAPPVMPPVNPTA